MTPLVSVIIPCYNLGAYIDEAIQSVLAQTRDDFEILVVDDGSTDEATRTLLASRTWPATKVFRTENRGLGGARNFLIERAQGRYLCALDADDKLHPQYFETTLAAFGRDPALTFVSTRLQMFGEQDLVWPPDLRCDLPTLLSDCPVVSAALVRRAAVLEVGGYDAHMPAQGDEDWDLWISLLEAGHRGLILPDILFYYRRRAGSLCDICTRSETHLGLLEYLIRKHEASYRTHLMAALAWKEARIDEHRRARAAIEENNESYLAPTIDRRRAELAHLRSLVSRLDPSCVERDHAALQAEYERSQAEVAALRASVSWRVTAPLRAAYDLLLGQRGGSAQ